MPDVRRQVLSDADVAELYRRQQAVTRRLQYGVFALLIIVLTLVLYGIIIGIVAPPTPRTATEAKLTVLEQMVQQNSKSGKAHFDYITGLIATKQYDDAADAVKNARKVLADWDLEYADAAEVSLLFQQEKYDETTKKARQLYDAAMKKRTDYVAAQKAKGFTVAVTDVDIEPLMTMLILEGRASGAQKDWDQAVKAFSEAIALDPLASDVLALRAAAYEELDDTDAALADYKAALKFIPDFQPALDGIKRIEGK